ALGVRRLPAPRVPVPLAANEVAPLAGTTRAQAPPARGRRQRPEVLPLMGRVSSLTCDNCGAGYRWEEVTYTCPACGPRWGTLSVHYDLDALRGRVTRESLARDGDRSIARYFELLPIGERKSIPAPRVGGTPLYDA